MGKDKNRIAILITNNTIINFFKKFFKSRKIYKEEYFKTPQAFIKYIEEKQPSAVIVDESLLSKVSGRIARFPTIAIICGDIQKGIENAVNHNVNRYIYNPYLARDLEYKLENIILEKVSIQHMNNEIRELKLLTELMQLISSTLDPKEILFRIVRKISEVMPVTRCSIIRVDWLRKNAFVVASFEDPNITGIKISLNKYPEIMKALKSKKPVIIKDTLRDPLMQKVRDIISPIGIRSILVIPILLHEKIIGTLFLRTSRYVYPFSENEVQLLNSIAAAAANALYNAFLFEQVEDEKTRLEKLALTDYLTGIFNIRYFYHRIIEEFSRCQRYVSPLSCLMLDIDHFKKINDIYGHKTGDKVLREFAQLLKKHSRKSDVLARYGGEEFIILLPQTTLEGAKFEAERFRSSVKEHRFKSMKHKSNLTVSIGVSSFPHLKIESHDELITFADDALFDAKGRGRDQVVVYGQ
jgi:diguanylate cyclase (GGDEF)-like protein